MCVTDFIATWHHVVSKNSPQLIVREVDESIAFVPTSKTRIHRLAVMSVAFKTWFVLAASPFLTTYFNYRGIHSRQ